jgi:hypothetical protein
MSIRLFVILIALPALAGCNIVDTKSVYSCRGELVERYDGETIISKDAIALIIYNDYVKLEGNSYLNAFINFVPPQKKEELKFNTLKICKSSSVTQIEFNSYGCDFESNVVLPSTEVTEGTFNDTLRQLTLTQYRKHKLSATRENDASLREPFHYRRTGNYTCELR